MVKAYVEPGEIALMEKVARCFRDQLLIRLLFHLGCRISEALNLEVKDIDFAEGTLTIEHLKAKVKLSCTQCGAGLGKGHIFCPKCGVKVEKAVAEQKERRRMRMLPVDKETMELLRDYIRRGGPTTRKGKQLIFGINRHRGWQIVKDCADQAGLGKLVNPETGKLHSVSPHRLRDAFAVHAMKMDDSGEGLRLLQEHLGHVSFNTTAKYRKIASEEHRQWYEKLWQQNGG